MLCEAGVKKTLILVSTIIGSASTIAHAQPIGGEADQRPAQRFELGATVGLGTPVGELGVEGAVVLHPDLEIGLGVGAANLVWGGGGGAQPQVAVMPRIRLPVGEHVRLTLGVGLSGGTYSDAASPFSGQPFAARGNALWVNSEVGVKYVQHDTYLGAYVGLGRVIAHGDIKDSEGNSLSSIPDDEWPSFGIRAGRAF